MVKMVHRHLPDLEVYDRSWNTPVLAACNDAIWWYLLAQGADFTAQNEHNAGVFDKYLPGSRALIEKILDKWPNIEFTNQVH